jgi:uncharacterized protein
MADFSFSHSLKEKMESFKSVLLSPWPWYVAGPLIALVMTSLLFLGRSFGMSSNLRTLCALSGAGKYAAFFRFDWRSQLWNLVFAVGAMTGGWLMQHLGSTAESVSLNPQVASHLAAMGVDVSNSWGPQAIFGTSSSWPTVAGWATLIVGGFLIGFGARWAGGCTSGHAISGLSDRQRGSLIAVMGFFVGGLAMSWWIFPLWIQLWKGQA